jgi:uncharacterized membrane protein
MNAIFRERGTERLETFSDGIFAFAITLLVLNLYDPTTRGSALFGGLLNEWPAFFALAASFMNILVMWINHHNMFNYIKRVSRELMLLNGLLLLVVVITPFTTLLVSEHLLLGDANIAAAAYSGSFFFLGLIWNILWHNASHHHNLISENVPQNQINRIAHEYLVAPFMFGLAVVLSFISAIASMVLILMTSVYFGVTVTGGENI